MWSGSNSSSAGAPSRARILQSLQERKRSRTNSISSADGGHGSSAESSSYGCNGGSGSHLNAPRGALQPAAGGKGGGGDPRRASQLHGAGPRSSGGAVPATSAPVVGMPRPAGLPSMPHGARPPPHQQHQPGSRQQQQRAPHQPFAAGPRHSAMGQDSGLFPQHGEVPPVAHHAHAHLVPARAPSPAVASDNPYLAAQQQAALQHALAQSNGFYVVQDSSFGNLILPVLPRVDSVK